MSLGPRAVQLEPQQPKSGWPAGAGILVLERGPEYLNRSLNRRLVTRVEAKTSRELFEKLVDLVVAHYPKVPRREMVEELIERESQFPNVLGHGVAVPHAYSAILSSRICAVAQIPEGIDFNAPDGELVRLAFLVLSPSGDPEGHLQTMAEIARLVSDPEIRRRLMEDPDPASVLMAAEELAAVVTTVESPAPSAESAGKNG